MQGSRFAFGPFVLDSGAGTLLRNDVPVAVGYRGIKLLAALVGRAGEILGKAELMDAAWPGTAVEEGNLTVQIALLRSCLARLQMAANGSPRFRASATASRGPSNSSARSENLYRCPASHR
ncbi:hypothetical protein MesoLjLa_04160 [Mesorhizobium sp. L-2-11]|nr:hypothetical protein MesoLjLa_04160 [Mesorhizobium sp. L-2-11]